jgi:hypothetical protein
MPSYDHESLLLLFRNHIGFAAILLRQLEVQLPDYDDVCTESSNVSNLQPAEYRADHVLFLRSGKKNVLGIIVEIQLGRDEDKPYTWPAYVANLRARYRCPVCLLVVTLDESVACWAGRTIELGPGSRCVPCVVGPSNTPAVTDTQEAEANVELAVLSAIEHGRSSDVAQAARIAAAAIVASAGVDAERSRLYLDLLLRHLSESARRATLETMNSLGYEYVSDFARHYVAQGREEGRAEGKAEGKVEGQVRVIIKLLASRFGHLDAALQTRISTATEAQLDALTDRILSVETLDEALRPLS